MDFSKDRQQDKEANEKSRHAVTQARQDVKNILQKLKDDELFQMDLKHPDVKKALDHWTNKKRLPQEEVEDWIDNYRIMAVMEKIKLLETHCKLAQIPVPLEAMMTGSTQLPDAASQAPAAAPAAAKAKANDSPDSSRDKSKVVSNKSKKKQSPDGKASISTENQKPGTPVATQQRPSSSGNSSLWINLIPLVMILLSHFAIKYFFPEYFGNHDDDEYFPDDED